MTETFEVGQRVKHGVHGEMEITYGPFEGSFSRVVYLARKDGETKERVTAPQTLSAIPEPPKFAVGDKVRGTYARTPYIIEAGPFFNGDYEWYAVKDEKGNVSNGGALALEAVETEPVKVGDRVRVVKDDPNSRTGQYVGMVGTLKMVQETSAYLPYLVEFGNGSGIHGDKVNGRWNVAEVERVDDDRNTVIIDGTSYDLTAKYRDNEGDVWTFERLPNGDVRGDYGDDAEVTEYSSFMESIVRNYGPLTRV